MGGELSVLRAQLLLQRALLAQPLREEGHRLRWVGLGFGFWLGLGFGFGLTPAPG